MFHLFSKQAASETGSARTVEDLQAWLDDLPPLDLQRSIGHMLDALRGTGDLDLPIRKRLPLLHAYRNKLVQILEGTYTAAPVSDAIAAKLDELLSRLAEVYKTSVSRDNMKLAVGCDFCTSIYCAMELQVHRLLLAYRGYGTPPWGGHREIHALMQIAEDARVLYQPVIVNDRPVESESVGKLYRRYLLMTLSDPYHVGNGEIYPLFKLLGRYVQDLTLGRSPDGMPEDTLFALDLDSDATAVPAGRLPKQTGKPLYLDLGKVVSSISRDRINEEASPRHRRYFETGRRLLEQIIPRFKAGQQRREKRVARSGPIAVVKGVDSLHRLISQRIPLRLPEIATPGLEVVIDDDPAPALIETWQVANQSECGLCLSCHGGIDSVQVGDLIGLGGINGAAAITLAVIRWMRRLDDGLIRLGTELLPGEITACSFQDGSTGILLQQTSKKLMVLVRKNQLRPGESHALRSRKRYVLRTNQVQFRTSQLDGLSCELKLEPVP